MLPFDIPKNLWQTAENGVAAMAISLKELNALPQQPQRKRKWTFGRFILFIFLLIIMIGLSAIFAILVDGIVKSSVN
jgi:hypothetical protein